MSENITNVKLLCVPLNNEYKHTLYFNKRTAQLNYFNSIPVSKSFSEFSYQRKDSKLRVNLSFDEALKYNYVMYQNTHYNNKWFYAFITDYEMKSDNLTELTLETDVLQTWLEERIIKPSFVEREHTIDDTIGLNTVPENLEMGEYICNYYYEDLSLIDLSVVVGVTASSSGVNYTGLRYDGLYSGIRYFAFPVASVDKLNEFIGKYDSGRAEAIKCMFIVPSKFIEVESNNQVKGSISNTLYNIELLRENFIKNDKYVPVNKKLYCYPYKYMLVSNNNGASAIYQIEHFGNGDSKGILFNVYGALTPGYSGIVVPISYKGVTVNMEEAIPLGKFPICNWTSDEYTNWLTQNSVNIGLNMVTGLGQIIAGGAIAVGSGGLGMAVGGSSIVGGVSAIANQLAQIHQMSFTPPQSKGNITSGDAVTAMGSNNMTFYGMSIKDEYIKIIDEYFSAYGYKTNRIKIPESNHRENWWYTKTIDANIHGQIPVEDLNKIKACYNNGITFWRTPENMMNYSLSNNIV